MLKWFLAFLLVLLPVQVFSQNNENALGDKLLKLKYQRDYHAYISRLEDLAKANPSNASVHQNLWEAYYITEQYDLVISASALALQKDPQCWFCYVAKWQAIRDQNPKNQDQIRRDLIRLQSTAHDIPASQTASYYLTLFKGWELLADSNKKNEIRVKLNAINDREVQDYLAQIDFVDLLRGNSPLSAEEFIEKYSFFANIDLVYRLGLNNKMQKNDPSSALDWINQWQKDRPMSRKAFFYGAKARAVLGQGHRKVKSDLKKSLKIIKRLDEKVVPSPYSRSTWQAHLDQFQSLIYLELAKLDLQQNRLRRALRHLNRSQDLYSPSAAYYYYRSNVLFKLGQKEQALFYLEKSANRGFAKEKLARAFQQIQGRSDATLDEFLEDLRNKNEVPHFTNQTSVLGLQNAGGSWVSWGDFDGDGDEDLLAGGSGLWEQKRNESGAIIFSKVWPLTGQSAIVTFQNGLWADIDQDGDLDLYLLRAKSLKSSESYDRVLINQGKGNPRFVDQTRRYLGPLKNRLSAAAAWADFNQDGWVDLYVANYEKPGQPIARGVQDVLLQNVKGKKFQVVTQKAGLQTSEPMCGRGVAWADVDNDGDQDLYVTNYRLDPNFLWVNQGDGTFRDQARSMGVRGHEVVGLYGHSIGAQWGDLNVDQNLDLVDGNLAHPRAMAYSDPTQIFYHDAEHFIFGEKVNGIDYEETHSDPSLGDIDNDGDLDLILTAVYPGKPLQVYQNLGKGKFEQITFVSGIHAQDTWGGAFADYDQDGDLDFAVAGAAGVQVFRNDSKKNNFLIVKPLHKKSKSLDIGARVTVFHPELGAQIREVQGGKGTGNQNSLPVEFGFGSLQQPVDLVIQFSNGEKKILEHVQLNQTLSVKP